MVNSRMGKGMVKEQPLTLGNKYEGEFRDDQPNGQGIETSPDGRKYVGEFKDGEYHGQGVE